MALGRGDVPDAVRAELLKLWPVSVDQVRPGVHRQIFFEMSSGRWQDQMAAMQASGKMRPYGSGTDVPTVAPFQTGLVKINPRPLGEARTFQFQTVQEVLAAIGTDLRSATDNWADSYENTRDSDCADTLRLNTATGYDTKAFFAADHPQRSKYQDGNTYSNTDTTGFALDHEGIKTLTGVMSDTIAYNEAGTRIMNMPTHIVTTRWKDFHQASAILLSQQRTGTADNDVNTLNQLGIQVLYWPVLSQGITGAATATNKEYVYAFKAQKGLIYVLKRGVRLKAWEREESDDLMASATFEGAMGWRDWRSGARQLIID